MTLVLLQVIALVSDGTHSSVSAEIIAKTSGPKGKGANNSDVFSGDFRRGPTESGELFEDQIHDALLHRRFRGCESCPPTADLFAIGSDDFRDSGVLHSKAYQLSVRRGIAIGLFGAR